MGRIMIVFAAASLTTISVHAQTVSIDCEAKDGALVQFDKSPAMTAWGPVRELINGTFKLDGEGNYSGSATTTLWPTMKDRLLPATWTPSMGNFMIYEPNWGGGKRPLKMIGVDITASAPRFRRAASASPTRDEADGVLIERYTCTIKCGDEVISGSPVACK
jgi:hypothetical protein